MPAIRSAFIAFWYALRPAIGISRAQKSLFPDRQWGAQGSTPRGKCHGSELASISFTYPCRVVRMLRRFATSKVRFTHDVWWDPVEGKTL